MRERTSKIGQSGGPTIRTWYIVVLRAFFVGEANIELTIFSLHFHHGEQLQTDKKIGAEFFSRRFSLMQGTILGWIDVELEDDVFLKLMTANFLTVHSVLHFWAVFLVA